MTSNAVMTNVSCAVEVFVAITLLHREQPDREDFTIREIIKRAAIENISGDMRSGVSVHASQHCVANRAPNPAKHRMLFATGKHTRRLLLPGDDTHSERTGKIFPDEREMPDKYLDLLDWAKKRYESYSVDVDQRFAHSNDPVWHSMKQPSSVSPSMEGDKLSDKGPRHLEALLQARGIGAHLAGDIDPDDHIRELREGWE